MRIEILCTGDEVLTGKIVNSNFSWMAQRLEDVGLDVHWGTTVGDDRAALLTAFHLAASRSDAVIVNGGLGPTVDDLSQEVAAQAAGVDLVLHEAWRRGARVDAWRESFKPKLWWQTVKDLGIDATFYVNRQRPITELLPWDHVNVKKGRAYLEKEQDRSVIQLKVMAEAVADGPGCS